MNASAHDASASDAASDDPPGRSFNARIVRGLKRCVPAVDLVALRDVNMESASDPEVLQWAGSEGRVLLTHDLSTVPMHAWDRVRDGVVMPGVIAVANEAPIGTVIDDLVLVIEVCKPDDLEKQILYLPL